MKEFITTLFNEIAIYMMIAVVILICYLLYKVLHMKNFIGDIFRISWNLTIAILSVFPGLGWITRLMVLDNEKEKEKLILEGDKADRETERRWEQEKREKEAFQEEENARRQEAEDDIRREVYQKTGRRDVEFNRDSSKWKMSDEAWEDGRNVHR